MINERRSKIVAKIADNRSEVPFLKSVVEAGADVMWLNTAHQDEPGTLGVIERIREVSHDLPILVDTKGPEVRTKNVETPLEVKPGDKVVLTGDLSVAGPNVVHVTYPNFHREVPAGESIFYDDASMELVVESADESGLTCVAKSGATIKNKKSLNIPNVHIELPALTEKDRGFVHFCAKHNVDYIIHSFMRSKADIDEIRDILKEYPDYRGGIIAKIENREGFDNLREILEHCDGLMVARGDLGAEVPLEEMTYMQKKMVEACLEMGKYCIVATQALDSMIKNPRPTRAEVTDVANAVLDGTCAVSMSGETAYGDYPVEATTTMGRIMRYTEQVRDELVHFTAKPTVASPAYARAAEIVAAADESEAPSIVMLDADRELAQAVSAYRPHAVVIAVTDKPEVVRELGLAYAVRPVRASAAEAGATVARILADKPHLAHGKVVIVAADGSFKVTGAEEIR